MNSIIIYMRKNLHISLSLAAIIIAAYYSNTYYHPDEYFQVIEFMSYKLGWSAASSLAWEFSAQIRPWIQPALYYCIIKFFMLFNIANPFTLLFLLRLFTGIVGWLSLLLFLKATNRWYFLKYSKIIFFLSFGLWYIPYLLVRLSSETLSAILLAFALSVLLLCEKKNPPNNGFFSGLLFGFSFVVRYQIAFALLGIFLWMIAVNKSRINFILIWIVGAFVSLIISIFVDYWGYGNWQVTPWIYFKVNILGKVLSEFGTSPFYAYFYLFPLKAYLLHGLILLIAMIMFWFRYQTNIVSWMTFSFFLGHSLIGHKEGRFLFPLAVIGTCFIPMLLFGYSQIRFLYEKIITKKCIKTIVYILIVLNGLAFVFLIVIPFGRDLSIQKYVYNSVRSHSDTIYQINDSMYIRNNLNMNFIKPSSLRISSLKNREELLNNMANTKHALYFTAYGNEFSTFNNEIKDKTEILCSSIPLFIERFFNFYSWIYTSKLYNLYRYTP